MMTRKDYVAVADILNRYSLSIDETTFDSLVESFAVMFREDNDRFLTEKFVDACWGE